MPGSEVARELEAIAAMLVQTTAAVEHIGDRVVLRGVARPGGRRHIVGTER